MLGSQTQTTADTANTTQLFITLKKGPISGEIGLKCRCKRWVTPEMAR